MRFVEGQFVRIWPGKHSEGNVQWIYSILLDLRDTCRPVEYSRRGTYENAGGAADWDSPGVLSLSFPYYLIYTREQLQPAL